MSQMRAGDLHAGAESTRRGGVASTATDDFVGSPTADAAGPRGESRAGTTSCQMIARGAPLQVIADSS